jgi:hypothetical protein
MTDEQLRLMEEFAKEYEHAPADHSFEDKARDVLAQLINSGVDESTAKRLLGNAVISADHRD